ncbi:hypothetical protein J437_LFUL007071 [Ladona fulva]|uniref:Uncharacterized protein n=1 Tax=Ladona fulva TaxID=123851 RepID=A0A8K0K5I8_LADFU|nr:hypothetical protein J437_LFUL007071 [Ladona fulva]
MKDILIFFHLYYQEIKEALEGSSYLDLMMPLVSMFIDMEIKASIRGKESLKKLASRLTSSLYLFLDNSEEHMLDAILMTKNVNKNYQEICNPLLWKILNNISNPKDPIFYVRCLLTFKLWKKIVQDPEERNRINKRALQKLHTPPNLLERVKALGNVLPRIPKAKKNITLFLLQSNFNLKDACREFLKSVKKTQETVYSQSIGNVETDKPLFFMSGSGSCVHLLSEKDVEVEKSHNSMDLWSSISADSIASPSDKLKELSSDQTMGVQMTVGSKKKRKLGKKIKKGKKKVKGSSGTKAKKKKKLKNSESARFEKGNKKASKLKAKKKKKKRLHQLDESSSVKPSIPQGCENSQIKVKQISSQIEEVNQVTVKLSSPLLIEDLIQSNVKSPLSLFEQGSQVNVKVVLAQPNESVSAKLAQAVPQILEESEVEKTVEEPMNSDQDVKIQSSSEMKDYELVVKDALLDKDQIKIEEGKGRLLDIHKTEKDQSETSFENSKSDLFGGKPKDLFNKEVEVLVDHPKTERMETSLSSSKQIFEATMASEFDDILGKKEKVSVISTCLIASCNLKKSKKL